MGLAATNFLSQLGCLTAIGVLSTIFCADSFAQQPPTGGIVPTPIPSAQRTPPYGAPLTLDMAKIAMVAAESEASKNGWNVAIAIVDSGGHLVMFHKFDDTHYVAIAVAEGKALTALGFRRPTKTLEDSIAAGGGGLRYLGVQDITPLDGGFPIIKDGKVIGAIGVAGNAAENDAIASKAGADALR